MVSLNLWNKSPVDYWLCRMWKLFVELWFEWRWLYKSCQFSKSHYWLSYEQILTTLLLLLFVVFNNESFIREAPHELFIQQLIMSHTLGWAMKIQQQTRQGLCNWRIYIFVEIEDIRFFKWSSKTIAFKTEKVLLPLMIWI